jgi:hypothetical protein
LPRDGFIEALSSKAKTILTHSTQPQTLWHELSLRPEKFSKQGQAVE